MTSHSFTAPIAGDSNAANYAMTVMTVENPIYVYSFALKPEEHQPSGSINLSRIDNASLQMSLTSTTGHNMKVYALSYNVLRCLSGMAGIAYSN
jgi:hypothetical protein